MKKYYRVVSNVTEQDIENEKVTILHNHIATLKEAEELVAGYEAKGDCAATWVESFLK